MPTGGPMGKLVAKKLVPQGGWYVSTILDVSTIVAVTPILSGR